MIMRLRPWEWAWVYPQFSIVTTITLLVFAVGVILAPGLWWCWAILGALIIIFGGFLPEDLSGRSREGLRRDACDRRGMFLRLTKIDVVPDRGDVRVVVRERYKRIGGRVYIDRRTFSSDDAEHAHAYVDEQIERLDNAKRDKGATAEARQLAKVLAEKIVSRERCV